MCAIFDNLKLKRSIIIVRSCICIDISLFMNTSIITTESPAATTKHTDTNQSRRSRRHWKRVDAIKEDKANAAANILSYTWEGQVTKPVDALNVPYNDATTMKTTNNVMNNDEPENNGFCIIA